MCAAEGAPFAGAACDRGRSRVTIRNLDSLFKPASVALFGASGEPGHLGNVILRNLRGGGFAGPVWAVNPKHREIDGARAYAGVSDLPAAPDLAVIATPPATIPKLIAELGEAGTKGAVVITAGFTELGNAGGRALAQDMLDAAKPHLLRIMGPNCVGLMVPEIGLNASFSHIAPLPGRIAFVSQSGAIIVGVLDWAADHGIGFSHVVSVGNMADIDFGDMIDYLARDGRTRALLLYMESVTNARKFLSAARAAARIMPVVVIKAGRHAEGAKAASSHTGALAGADAVYDAAFRRAGLLRVLALEELFEAVETLAKSPRAIGDRLAILSNGGGFGVLATDGLIDEGGVLAEVPQGTIEALDAVLPATWSHGNPIDIIGDAPGARYGAALEILLDDDANDAVLVLNCPTAVASSEDAARTVAATVTRLKPKKPVLASWIGGAGVAKGRQILEAAGLPTYETPKAAARAFMHLVRHQKSQEALMETPPSAPEEFAPDLPAAQAVIDAALAEKREWLTEPEAKAVLAAYAIPVAATRTAASPRDAGEAAKAIGGPVALKILSPDITHKSDVGGVVLDLENHGAVERAAEAMLARVRQAAPKARITGFSVQAMVKRPHAHELIVGLSEDRQFGPVLLFGAGGVAVEVIDDKALALPPLNINLAREVMARTRIHRQLLGYRDRPAADLDALALTLVKVSRLAADIGEIAELDINPLYADEGGVVALDARIRVARMAEGRTAESRLAIRPYPKGLEESVEMGDGKVYLLRPVLPEDEPMFREAFKRLSPEAVRLRFFAPLRELSHEMAARLTQIDYDREMALVLADPGPAGRSTVHGVSRITADPDNERAEFAVVVVSNMIGLGLGALLMRRIIDYARSRGIGEIFGDVLAENRSMLKLCRTLGFALTHQPDEPGIIRATLSLRPPAGD